LSIDKELDDDCRQVVKVSEAERAKAQPVHSAEPNAQVGEPRKDQDHTECG